jgi:hypothetical protein
MAEVFKRVSDAQAKRMVINWFLNGRMVPTKRLPDDEGLPEETHSPAPEVE